MNRNVIIKDIWMTVILLFIGVNAICSSSFPSKVDMLKKAYNENDSELFWRNFPDTFHELIELYGYDTSLGQPKELYSESYLHIKFLFKSCAVPDVKHFEKLYGIAKDGYWDADAANYFHEGVWKLTLSYPSIWMKVFEGKKDSELIDFWKYVISTPHPEASNQSYFKKYMDTLKCYASYSDSIVRILHISYLELFDEWSEKCGADTVL